MSLIEKAAKRLEELRKAGFRSRQPDAARVEPVDSGNGAASAGPVDEPLPDPGAPAVQPLPAALPPLPEPGPPADKVAPAETGAGRSRSRFIQLDQQLLAQAGLIVPGTDKSRLAEEFRVLKLPLIANISGKGVVPVANGNLIMVTSAVPGEGKTFTAANLALSIAMELDRTVLLVDADVARPSLPKVFGLPGGPGLLDIVRNRSLNPADALLRTSIEKLSILPSGTPDARATELLASAEMTALIGDLSTRYPDRVIIFDSPPLLATTESRVLATHMGQIVFVARAEATPQREVLQALATIDTCPVKLMVLNQVSSAGSARYAYGYGYGHSH